MHRPETKTDTEVNILCNKPTLQTKSMTTNHRIKLRICETILCRTLAPSVE
jgi:hypothetical protein